MNSFFCSPYFRTWTLWDEAGRLKPGVRHTCSAEGLNGPSGPLGLSVGLHQWSPSCSIWPPPIKMAAASLSCLYRGLVVTSCDIKSLILLKYTLFKKKMLYIQRGNRVSLDPGFKSQFSASVFSSLEWG